MGIVPNILIQKSIINLITIQNFMSDYVTIHQQKGDDVEEFYEDTFI